MVEAEELMMAAKEDDELNEKGMKFGKEGDKEEGRVSAEGMETGNKVGKEEVGVYVEGMKREEEEEMGNVGAEGEGVQEGVSRRRTSQRACSLVTTEKNRLLTEDYYSFEDEDELGKSGRRRGRGRSVGRGHQVEDGGSPVEERGGGRAVRSGRVVEVVEKSGEERNCKFEDDKTPKQSDGIKRGRGRPAGSGRGKSGQGRPVASGQEAEAVKKSEEEGNCNYEDRNTLKQSVGKKRGRGRPPGSGRVAEPVEKSEKGDHCNFKDENTPMKTPMRERGQMESVGIVHVAEADGKEESQKPSRKRKQMQDEARDQDEVGNSGGGNETTGKRKHPARSNRENHIPVPEQEPKKRRGKNVDASFYDNFSILLS